MFVQSGGEPLNFQESLQHKTDLLLVRHLVLMDPNRHGCISYVLLRGAAVSPEHRAKFSKPSTNTSRQQPLIDLSGQWSEIANVNHQDGHEAFRLQNSCSLVSQY